MIRFQSFSESELLDCEIHKPISVPSYVEQNGYKGLRLDTVIPFLRLKGYIQPNGVECFPSPDQSGSDKTPAG